MKAENLKKIIELRHRLHSLAELSGQEAETKATLMEFVRENTDFDVVDRGKWFYCEKRGEGAFDRTAIAFRADMDALPIDETLKLSYASTHPGVSHKCGHDGHSAALAGLALELTGTAFEWPIILIFQHAEETGQGGKDCAQLIRERNIEEIYAFHNLSGYPEGSIILRKGLTQPASEGLTIHFQGKASHASYPEQGANPSYAIADLLSFIRTLQHFPHKGMVLCTVVQIAAGDKDFGISAGDGEISVTLRAEAEEEMLQMETAIREKAIELGKRDRLAVSFAISDYFPETRNHAKGVESVERAAFSLNKSIIFMKDLWRASEDFGWYLKECPGAIFYIGNGEDWPALHTEAYDFNDRILETAVDMFLGILRCRA